MLLRPWTSTVKMSGEQFCCNTNTQTQRWMIQYPFSWIPLNETTRSMKENKGKDRDFLGKDLYLFCRLVAALYCYFVWPVSRVQFFCHFPSQTWHKGAMIRCLSRAAFFNNSEKQLKGLKIREWLIRFGTCISWESIELLQPMDCVHTEWCQIQ